MFGLFKNKKEIKITDYVWKNDAAKYKGILKNLDVASKNIFVYYFREVKDELEKHLQGTLKEYTTNFPSSQNIIVLQADSILNTISDLSAYKIIFAEHHPSYSIEQKVLQHLLNDLNVSKIDFHISLEEPLLHYFGGDNITGLLEKMGMPEDESLQHSMISASIVNAQKKIDEKSPNSIETSSAKGWFEVNFNS